MTAARTPRAPRPRPDFSLETALARGLAPGAPVCGVDEAGRGPWAGPVCAAAVILDRDATPAGIDDSKRLSAARREASAARLREAAAIGIGFASVEEIDRLNIRVATHLAMRRAVAALPVAPAAALIDGREVPAGLPCVAEAVIGGDARSLSVAAASIIAKTARDAVMVELARAHPGYGWESNKGYGVAAHAEGLRRSGVTPHHRRSFRPVHKMLS